MRPAAALALTPPLLRGRRREAKPAAAGAPLPRDRRPRLMFRRLHSVPTPPPRRRLRRRRVATFSPDPLILVFCSVIECLVSYLPVFPSSLFSQVRGHRRPAVLTGQKRGHHVRGRAVIHTATPSRFERQPSHLLLCPQHSGDHVNASKTLSYAQSIRRHKQCKTSKMLASQTMTKLLWVGS
jgi:hypothetical protein